MTCAPSEDSDQPVYDKSFRWAPEESLVLFTHKAHSEGSDMTGREPSLVYILYGRNVVLSSHLLLKTLHYKVENCWLNFLRILNIWIMQNPSRLFRKKN